MLKKRVVSAVIGVPILLAFLFLHRVSFFILVVALTVLGLDEFYSLLKPKGKKPHVFLGIIGGILLCSGALFKGLTGIAATLVILLVVAMIWYLFTPDKQGFDMILTIIGVLYVGFLFSHLILIRNLGKNSQGIYLVLLVFVATWVYDITAYVAGSRWGKKKLAPKISPNKTWVGAIVAALMSMMVLGSLVFISWLPLAKRVLLGFVVGVAAPIGDLVESRIKREVGVKDSSSRIPGHGGILDRFDSLLFTGAASYYLLRAIL